jgi:hypothetical protein
MGEPRRKYTIASNFRADFPPFLMVELDLRYMYTYIFLFIYIYSHSGCAFDRGGGGVLNGLMKVPTNPRYSLSNVNGALLCADAIFRLLSRSEPKRKEIATQQTTRLYLSCVISAYILPNLPI